MLVSDPHCLRKKFSPCTTDAVQTHGCTTIEPAAAVAKGISGRSNIQRVCAGIKFQPCQDTSLVSLVPRSIEAFMQDRATRRQTISAFVVRLMQRDSMFVIFLTLSIIPVMCERIL